MRYVTPDDSTVAGAVLTSLAPSQVWRELSATLGGSGTIELTGDYTGQEDATFEVEVTGVDATASPIVHVASYAGTGDPSISDLAVTPGTASQVITITLVDTGTVDRRAFAQLGAVYVEAREEGLAGDGVAVTISRAGIVETATQYTLTEPIEAGANTYVGSQWDFGARVLTPEGDIPSTAPRIRIVGDSQVYRHFSRYDEDEGRIVYGFSPTPRRGIDAGRAVLAVSGTYTLRVLARVWQSALAYVLGQRRRPTADNAYTYVVTVAGTTGASEPTWPTTIGATVVDGTVTWTCEAQESYAGATLYDLLAGVREASHLLQIVSPMVRDLRPGGIGAEDVSLWTQPYAAAAQFDGTSYVRRGGITVEPDATAVQETVTIECIEALAAGQERWAVRGALTGELGQVVTGTGATLGAYAITVPTIIPPSPPVLDPLVVTVQQQGAEDAGLCVSGKTLGPRARARVLAWEWRERPDSDGGVLGAPCGDCQAGLVGGPEGSGVSVPGWRADRLRRLAEFIERSEFSSSPDFVANNAVISVDYRPRLFAAFAAALTDIATAADVTGAAWTATTGIDRDSLRRPTVRNGYIYRATSQAGTTGASEPTWPTTIGATVVDGTVTWQAVAEEALAAWDDVLRLHRLTPSTMTAWAGAAAIPQYELRRPTAENGYAYVAVTGGTTAGAEPTWPTTIGATVVDGTVTWQAVERPFILALPDSSVAPYKSAAHFESEAADVITRFVARLDAVRALAGVEPRLGKAEGQSPSGLWPGYSGTHWFVPVESNDLVPLAPGYYYQSRRIETVDGVGTLVDTQEFGVGIKFCDADRLQPGDRLEISVNGAVLAYQVGDVAEVAIVDASPIGTDGGQVGSNTMTWSVASSTTGSRPAYSQALSSPAVYAGGPVAFRITAGAIRGRLGDRYQLAVEGGLVRWRKNGGAWTTGVAIADAVSLSDGVSARFVRGAALPSYEVGDIVSLVARAIHGPSQAASPTEGVMRWTAAATLTGTSATVRCALVWMAGTYAGTITLQGSDDAFATTSTSAALVEVRPGVWWVELPSDVTRSAWRLAFSAAGSSRWAQWGTIFAASIAEGHSEPGSVELTDLATAAAEYGGRVSVSHRMLDGGSQAGIRSRIRAARRDHDGIVCLVIDSAEVVIGRAFGDVRVTDDASAFAAASASRRVAIAAEFERLA